MSSFVPSAAQLLGRILLSIIFILGGIAKLTAPGPTIASIGASGLPVPELAYYVSVLVELGGGLLILFGFQTRLAALVLAAWCVVTGVIFHYHPGDQGQMIHYMKNLAMAGGFLQLFVAGAGAWSVDALLRRKAA
jgi:putative oxidoreductase